MKIEMLERKHLLCGRYVVTAVTLDSRQEEWKRGRGGSVRGMCTFCLSQFLLSISPASDLSSSPGLNEIGCMVNVPAFTTCPGICPGDEWPWWSCLTFTCSHVE